jgi:hypothetical protein
VPFDSVSNKNEDEIIEQAWELINIRLMEQIQENEEKSSLINKKWIPKEFREEEKEEEIKKL